MIWVIWGERAGAPSTVNRCRISACGYCGKQHADITTNSVTLCDISTCGYFCGYFAWIGNISDILMVWYFGQSPVEVEFMNMWWLNLDKVTFPVADVLIFFPILLAVLIRTHYSYKVTLQGEVPHWMCWKLPCFGRPSVRWTTWSIQRRNRWIL